MEKKLVEKTDAKVDAKKDAIKVRIPQSLTLRDLITIVGTAITLAIGWATFSARVANLETEVVELKQQIQEAEKTIRNLETRQHEDQLFIDQIYETLRRPQPRRYEQERR